LPATVEIIENRQLGLDGSEQAHGVPTIQQNHDADDDVSRFPGHITFAGGGGVCTDQPKDGAR